MENVRSYGLRAGPACHGESGALLFSRNTFWQENPLVIGPGAAVSKPS